MPGGDRDSIDVVAAERRGAILQDQLAKREQSGRVAQIFDVGDRDGYFYIAMEYIEGEDLSELVAHGPHRPAARRRYRARYPRRPRQGAYFPDRD